MFLVKTINDFKVTKICFFNQKIQEIFPKMKSALRKKQYNDKMQSIYI
jgi:hypothetical protein